MIASLPFTALPQTTFRTAAHFGQGPDHPLQWADNIHHEANMLELTEGLEPGDALDVAMLNDGLLEEGFRGEHETPDLIAEYREAYHGDEGPDFV